MGALTVHVGVATRSRDGEGESGDLHLVLPGPDRTLVAIMDGVGHGPQAALATRVTAAILERHPAESLPELFRRCHQGLLKTRGVVLFLACFRPSRMSWLGVGNIEGFLARGQGGHPEYLLSGQGIVGYRLPEVMRERELAVVSGDMAVFATDGISDLGSFLPSSAEPQVFAERVLAQGSVRRDDALVLAARLQ